MGAAALQNLRGHGYTQLSATVAMPEWSILQWLVLDLSSPSKQTHNLSSSSPASEIQVQVLPAARRSQVKQEKKE
jgi:hypothetical protein